MVDRTPPRAPIPSRSETDQGIISPDSGTEEFKQIQLVLDGYTVTTNAAALWRVADRYVMRNLSGHRVELPLLVNIASFVQTWTTFRRLSETGQTATDGLVTDHVVPAAVHEYTTAPLLATESTMDLSVVDGRRAMGDRITIHGRVLNEHGKPLPSTNIEMWQANAAGRYQHTGHEYDAPLDPNFSGNGVVRAGRDGRFRILTVAPGHYRDEGSAHMKPNHLHFIYSVLA
jgi:hypothetical protein